MTTTLQALQAGSTNYKLVVAIQGYPYLLSEASTTATLAAWTASDWGSSGDVIQALFVDIKNQQSLNPWEPFTGGGRCTLRVGRDTTWGDQFGIDTNRASAGLETTLAATLDRNDTTATVADTTGWGATGAFNIGTEYCFYSGKTATTFTGLTRGAFAPFKEDPAGLGFGEDHRVGTGQIGDPLKPLVTAQPRVWIGRRVGVWMHRVAADGTLDTLANAQLVYAGRIVSINDDANDFTTVLELSHVLDEIKEATVGRDMWSAKVREGIWLRVGLVFGFVDMNNTNGGTPRTANALTVVSGAPASVNEIKTGRYTLSDLCAKINAWLASELNAGRLYGSYSFESPVDSGAGKRSNIMWRIPNAGSTNTMWSMRMPVIAARFLGFDQGTPLDTGNDFTISSHGPDDTNSNKFSDFAPYKYVVFRQLDNVNQDFRFEVDDERGTFADQLASLPPPPPSTSGTWGIFLLGNQYTILGQYDASGDPTVIKNVTPTIQIAGTGKPPGIGSTEGYAITVDDNVVLEVRQVFVFVGTFADMFLRFLFSTGTTGYNEATYDTLPQGVGLGIPAELMTNMVASALAMPNPSAPLTVVLAKPTKFSDLFGGDLTPRFAFPRWKNGSLEMRTWILPTTADSVATLSESTKAAPVGNTDNHRTVTVTDAQWARPVVKVNYNRSITGSSDDAAYQSSFTFEDSVAVDDAGGQGKVITIDARNTYAEGVGAGQALEQLMPGFLAMLPLFSRPFRKVTRSIDVRYFEGLSVGDVVTFSDSFARDPDSGNRGITTRPALVIGHRWSPGGKTSPNQNKATDMVGEIDLMLLQLDRIAAYGPAAQVDDTAAGAGYNAGTKVLTFYAHKHSEASETADAQRFANGDKVRILEIDPSDPASPLTWQDTINGAPSGNTVTLTTGLAGYDTAKFYRMVYDAYTTDQTSQQVKCFQASGSTVSIQATRAPFQYSVRWPDFTYTANAASDKVELPANLTFGDGKSLDAGHDMALITLNNALLDRKCAYSAPFLSDTVASGSGATGTYRLAMYWPIFLLEEVFTGNCYRLLTVAPWLRSSDGTVASVRVTLSDTRPNASTIDDMSLGANYVSLQFSSSSTTWGTGSSGTLDVRVKPDHGIAWLILECTAKAETRGLAICQLGERT